MLDNEDLTSVIEKIIQNPEFAGMVNSMRGESEQKNTADISKEMMNKLPGVMSMVSSMLNSDGEENTKHKNSDESKKINSVLSGLNISRHDKDKAEKLLRALRPYLNGNRCEIIDKCVSVMQITDVVGALQGIDKLGKSSEKDGE